MTKTHEGEVIDRCVSRFGDEPTQEQLDAITQEQWNALARARSHQDRQDAFDAILETIDAA